MPSVQPKVHKSELSMENTYAIVFQPHAVPCLTYITIESESELVDRPQLPNISTSFHLMM